MYLTLYWVRFFVFWLILTNDLWFSDHGSVAKTTTTNQTTHFHAGGYMRYQLSDLIPTELANGIGAQEIEVPEWAFTPDPWNIAFLRGLLATASTLAHEKVWEVGVGTGLVQLFLAHWGVRQSVFSDYDARCVPLAQENLARTGLHHSGLVPLDGVWDLIDRVDEPGQRPDATTIVACIPQLPSAGPAKHHYDPARYPEATLHHIGLGLNEALLRRTRNAFPMGSRAVLNLAGRPGLKRLLQMFHDCGYQQRILHEELVPQHLGPSLDAFLAAEDDGHGPFEFFRTPVFDRPNPINAHQGAARLRAGDQLFHTIYVIEGTIA